MSGHTSGTSIQRRFTGWLRRGGALLAALLGFSAHATVLDNFNDNTKTGWTDFTFQPGFGIPTEAGGQFRFEQPPAGQSIFSASQKTSERFELKEGRNIEFRTDVVQGGAKDSFAILAFIPTSGSPGTLGGYGLAKSTTDILITKGINKYFVAEDGAAANLKQDNITLVLGLSVRGGSVFINAKILDKDANNAVLWERTVVDTAAADVLSDGTDDPAAPYVTSGYFTLYLYQDFDAGAPESPYTAVYDNAEVFVTDTAVVDDFNDNTKTGWTDFTFQPGFGIPAETGGQFRFEHPPAGQSIFSASQKTSKVFTLSEGDRVAFSVDVIEGGAKDSFAILAFIPTSGSPGTLGGYGLAKSTTDFLITKGINKYFVAEDGAPANLKQNNITLNLAMTVRNGSVHIDASILDKDANNAVIWSRSVVDTASADVLSDGTDDPPAPYLTAGYFTLYLYQDFDAGAPESPYKAYFDNAIVAAPPVAANVAPIISEISPTKFGNFLPASTTISFKVTDDAALDPAGLAVVLNGTRRTSTNGLNVTGTGSTRTVSLGGLEANRNYNAVLEATDAGGLTSRERLDFDTFASNVVVVESEDYNFGGQFIDNPVPITEGAGPQGDSYANQTGFQGIDFNDTRTNPNGSETQWRQSDPVRMERTLDPARAKYTTAGGSANLVFDYALGDFVDGEWYNYTRTFAPGSYEVYLRQALINMEAGESVLEEVTSDRSLPDQTTRILGSFLATLSGFEFRNAPLTDGTGQKTVVRLNGVTTLRLRVVGSDNSTQQRRQNYLVFVPVADTGIQRATVSSLSPANNATVATTTPQLTAVIQNRDTSVDTNSVRLSVNGSAVAATVTPSTTGATVSYLLPTLPAVGAVQQARLVFSDSQGVPQTNDWSFAFRYLELDPATRMTAAGSVRGFNVRVVQAPADSAALENSLARAEAQLAPGSTIPRAYETNLVDAVINYSQDAFAGGNAGLIEGDLPIPGQSDEGGTENWAMEATAFLDLPAGIVRFGVVSDDGYKISTAIAPNASTPALEFHNGGPANETFDVVVRTAGVYGFRLVWYERTGGANVEWFTVDTTTGDRTLVNATGGVRAFTTATPPVQVVLQGASALNGSFAAVAGAQVDTTAKTVTVPVPTGAAFYRLSGATSLTLTGIRVEGANLVITYR
jgi:hypothetical protein